MADEPDKDDDGVEPNPDRFMWRVGDLELISDPYMSAEQIKAWNAEQRAARSQGDG